jgi:hypothetical protein
VKKFLLPIIFSITFLQACDYGKITICPPGNIVFMKNVGYATGGWGNYYDTIIVEKYSNNTNFQQLILKDTFILYKNSSNIISVITGLSFKEDGVPNTNMDYIFKNSDASKSVKVSNFQFDYQLQKNYNGCTSQILSVNFDNSYGTFQKKEQIILIDFK